MWNGLNPFQATPWLVIFCAAPLGVSMMSHPPGSTDAAAAATKAWGSGTCSMTSVAVTSGNCRDAGDVLYCSMVPVNSSSPNLDLAYSDASGEISTPAAPHPSRLSTAGKYPRPQPTSRLRLVP